MKQNFNFKKIFLITMVISLIISALIGIFIFLFGTFGEIELKLLLSTLTIGIYSLTGLCCSVLYERERFSSLAVAGIIISILGFVYTLSMIWDIIHTVDYSFEILMIFIVATFSLAHTCLLLLIESRSFAVNGSLLATIASILIVALMLIIMILDNIDLDEIYLRLLGVFAILDVLGTIVTPTLNKIYSIKN